MHTDFHAHAQMLTSLVLAIVMWEPPTVNLALWEPPTVNLALWEPPTVIMHILQIVLKLYFNSLSDMELTL
jgi:hypothetical protein